MCDIFFKTAFAVMLMACCGAQIYLSKEFFDIGDKVAGTLYIAETLVLGLCAVGLMCV